MADGVASPRGLRWSTVVAVVAVLVAGVAGALAVRAAERNDDAERRRATIDRVVATIEETRGDALAAGVAGPSAVDAAGRFAPSAFADLARPFAEGSSATLVSYVEVVPAAERARWEAQWGVPIVGAQPGTVDTAPVGPQDEHLVLTGLYPREPWFQALRGWDLTSVPVFAETAAAAEAAGDARASPPFDFPTGERGFLLVVPVTAGNGSLVGFVAPFYSADVLVEGMVASVPPGGSVAVTDAGQELFRTSGGRGPTTDQEIDVLGRTWTVAVQAPPAPADWPLLLFGSLALAAVVGVLLWRADRAAGAREAMLAAEQAARARADEAQAALATSEERFRALLSAITKIVFIADRHGDMLPSESWERFTGQAPGDYVGTGKGGFDAVHPDDRASLEAAWSDAMASGERFDGTYRLRRADGEHRRVTVAAIPMHAPDGSVQEWVGAIADVEDRLRADERAQVISRNAARLAGAGTIEEVARATLADLGELGVTKGAVRVLSSGSVEVIGALGVDTAAFSRYSGIPLSADPTPSGEAMRRGQPVVVRNGDELAAQYPDSVPLRDDAGAETVVAFPLRTAEGGVVGSLTVGSAQPDWLTDDVHQLLGGMAEQMGLALERARLQTKVAEGSKRASFLAGLSDALERRVTVRERAEQAVEMIGERWDVVAAVCLRDPEGHLELLAASTPWVDVDPTDLIDPPDGDVVRIPDVPGTVTTRPGGGHRLVLPLIARGRELGVLVVDVGARPGAAAGMDGALARDTGARLALALDNARMYEHERDVSHALQVGLLSGALHEVEGLLVSSTYRPGTEALEVGGDWYDVFEVEDGRVALVIGDVVGHGLEAAVAMGQLRGAVRALAPGCTPAELLDRLDAFVAGLPSAGMATITYAELDPATGELRYACAGHPPPLVVTPTGARLLWDGRSTPLGCTFGATRGAAVVTLDPGDGLVLCTDGLVERREEPIDEGFARLAAAAEAIVPFDGAYADRLADRLLGADVHDDDACVLALERAPAARQFSQALVADPAEVGALRRRLAPWLRARGLHPDTTQAVLLAVSEAAANALEHGYGFDGRGLTTVDAVVADATLRITVRDEGRWKEPRAGTERGRGTPIMHTLMDEVQVERRPSGTTVTMCLVLPSAVPR